MPRKPTVKKARADRRRGKSPSTQAGNFVREEIDEIRAGEHGAKNAKQAIAIGLSKARRAGVDIGANPNVPKSKSKKKKARAAKKRSTTRSNAAKKALKKQPRAAASHRALSRQAKAAARRRKLGR